MVKLIYVRQYFIKIFKETPQYTLVKTYSKTKKYWQ